MLFVKLDDNSQSDVKIINSGLKDNVNYLKSMSVYRVQIYGENVYTDKFELTKNIFIDEFNYK